MVTTTDDVVAALLADDAHAAARGPASASAFCPCDDGHAADRAVDHLLSLW